MVKEKTVRELVATEAKVYPADGHETGTTNDQKRIDVLEEKMKKLDERAIAINKSLSKSEKKQDKALTFMMGIASITIVAFSLALIPLLFDYYKDNAERYEKFIKKIDQIEYRMDSLEKNNLCR